MVVDMNREKKLLKNTGIFIIGNFGAKILNFILIPFYTYYLSTSELGIFDMIVTIVSLVSPLISLGLYDSVYRWLMDKKEDKNIVLTTTSFIFLFSIIISSIFIIIILFFMKSEFIISFTILLFSNAIYVFLQFITRGLKENTEYAFQGIIYSIINFLMCMLTVVYFQFSYNGLIYATSFSNIIVSIYLFIKLDVRKYMRKSFFSKSMSVEVIKYAIALIPNNISWWVVSSSDRFLITIFLGISYNGIWAISNKFPAFVQLFTSLFYLSWQEQAIEEYDSTDRDNYYSSIFYYYSNFLLSTTLILIPLSKLVILCFMNPSYSISSRYISFLLLGTAFSSFSSFYGTGYLSSKKTIGAFFTTILGAVINFIINILFITYIGLYAAAISTMISYFVIWIYRIYSTRDFFNIHLNKKRIAVLLLLNLLSSIAIIYLDEYLEIIIMIIFTSFCFVIFNKKMIMKLINKLNKKDN